MSKSRKLYPFTSPPHSAERVGLLKIDRLIDIMTEVLEKLDEDNGISQDDFKDTIQELKDLKDSLRTPKNDTL